VKDIYRNEILEPGQIVPLYYAGWSGKIKCHAKLVKYISEKSACNSQAWVVALNNGEEIAWDIVNPDMSTKSLFRKYSKFTVDYTNPAYDGIFSWVINATT